MSPCRRRDFQSEEHGILKKNGRLSTKVLTPVSRLPPELLSAIFLHLRDMQQSDPFPDIMGPKEPPVLRCVRRLGWMLMLQVCQTWRDVAIGNPSLWTRVPFSLGYSWAKCMLSRSQSMPVSIEITRQDFACSADEAREDGELVAPHLSHACALTMTASDHWLQLALPSLARPAPTLHTVHIKNSSPSHLMTQHISAPDDLFACHTPSLRDVALNDVFVPWTSSLFTGLQSLFIQHSFRDPTYDHREWAPTLTEFLDALERMPSLEHLCIEGPLPNYDSDLHSLYPPSSARKVSLVNLECELQLGGRMRNVALVLGHLATPGNIVLGLEIMPYDGDEELELQDFFHAVSNHIKPRARSHIPVMEMRIDDRSGFCLSTLSASSEDGDKHHVFLEFADSDVDKPNALYHFLETLPFCPILRVEIYGLEFDRNDWREAFESPDGHAASISCISIKGGYLGEFCSFLCRPDTPLTELGLELPLPDLESLEFKEYSFGMSYVRQLLLEALQKRKEQDKPIEWLKFTHCSSLNSRWLDKLKGIVPEVEIEK